MRRRRWGRFINRIRIRRADSYFRLSFQRKWKRVFCMGIAKILRSPYFYLAVGIILVFLLFHFESEREERKRKAEEKQEETQEQWQTGNEVMVCDQNGQNKEDKDDSEETMGDSRGNGDPEEEWKKIWQEMNQTDICNYNGENRQNGEEAFDREVMNRESYDNGVSDNGASNSSKADGEVSENEAVRVISGNSLPVLPDLRPCMINCLVKSGYNLEQLQDYTNLKKTFFTLNSNTSVTPEILDAKKMLSMDLSIKNKEGNPQILIYHTHSQEAYIDSRPGHVEDTIVGVGDRLTELLTKKGYHVMHHTGIYDMTDGVLDRDPAYQKAAPVIEQILRENPDIEVVIDLHRDGVKEDVHLVTNVNGKNTARIMFFNGVCRDDNGELPELKNPYREENLAFSFQMRMASYLYAPDFCRTNYLKTWRYNEHFLGRCILIETGAQTNTVEEAMNAMEPVAEMLDLVLGE